MFPCFLLPDYLLKAFLSWSYSFQRAFCEYNNVNFQKDRAYFQDYIERYAAKGADIYLLEYTRDNSLIREIREYCQKNRFHYYISDSLELDWTAILYVDSVNLVIWSTADVSAGDRFMVVCLEAFKTIKYMPVLLNFALTFLPGALSTSDRFCFLHLPFFPEK